MTTNRQGVHIVVTCSNRKRRPVPAALQLRGTPGAQPKQRAARWLQRLTVGDTDSLPAANLYAGEHWDIARSLPHIATGFNHARLWIASAGWGLIPSDAPIHAYSATFSLRHPDSVATDTYGVQVWWEALAAWQGPAPGSPRSLTTLVSEYPCDRVLVALPQSYLAACGSDLRAALDLAGDGQVSIVSAGLTTQADLGAWQLPADARLQQTLGGTRGALNVRLVADLLQAGLCDHHTMQAHLQRQLAQAPELTVFERSRLTDDDVLAFIRARRAADPQASRTRLLRELRDSGRACEQSRFGQLFATVIRSES